MVRKLTVFMILGLLLASAGFAAAAIGSHGKLLSLLTSTSSTSSTMTSTMPGQRWVTICHTTGSWKHRWHGSWKHRWHTITLAQPAVAAHLRHGDYLGPCLVAPPTTTSTTTTTSTIAHGNSEHSGSDSDADGSGHSEGAHGNSGNNASAHGHGHDD
jgi:hypothetical protein